jgi:transcriptional regulator
MLIHPWDAATGPAEWQDWLATTDRFGMLAVNNLDPARAPLVLPVHFTVAGDELLMHLARPNPAWPHLEAAAEVRLAVTGDYAYIPTYWRAKAGGPDEDGVPTSYYTAVQFVCRPAVVDDLQGKAEILTAQLTDFQPRRRPRHRGRRHSAVRADAARHPRRPAGGAAGRRQVQIRRRQPRRAP